MKNPIKILMKKMFYFNTLLSDKGDILGDFKLPAYDYEQYQKSLSVILEQASKEYWAQHIDINRHQIMVGRTYLWVSVALLGSYFTIYRLILDDLVCCLSVIFALVSAVSVILAAGAFGLCLYALPGRKGYLRVGESWRTFAGNAYRSLENESQAIHSETLTDLIEKFDLAIEHGAKTNFLRARMLRCTSWLLLGSFVIAMIAGLIYFIEMLVF